MKSLVIVIAVSLLVTGGLTYYKWAFEKPSPIRLTGVVAANEVIVAAQIGGRIQQLNVAEGSWVRRHELVARLDREELEAEKQHQLALISQLSAKLQQTQEVVGLERDRTRSQVGGAEAELQQAQSQREQAVAEHRQLQQDSERNRGLVQKGLVSRQQGEQLETSLRVAQSRVKSLKERIVEARAALELARANERQVTVATGEVEQTRAQLQQAHAQLTQVSARLGYTELRAPLSGMVSLRVARQGEVVGPGDPIVTIVDLNDVWVRAEVEESYVARVKVGQALRVQLASGEELEGKVNFISPEAEFATQRDVSRVKRDIRTFGIKVAVPNREHRVHAGMTAYVLLPEGGSSSVALDSQREEPNRPEEAALAPLRGSMSPAVTDPVETSDGAGLPRLVLQVTSVVDGRPVAVLHSRKVFEGEVIEGARVLKISERAVEVEYQGRRFTIKF